MNCSDLHIELVARVPHRLAMAGPRAAACAGEIRSGHGGPKSRETSVARNWHRSGPCQFQGVLSLGWSWQWIRLSKNEHEQPTHRCRYSQSRDPPRKWVDDKLS